MGRVYLPVKRTISRTGLYLLLGLSAVFFLTPIYVLLVTGLKSFQDVNLEQMWALPARIYPQTFFQALTKLAPNFKNSLVMTVPATLISSILGALNGYVFAKWRFKLANLLFPVILFGMFIPYQSILIPLVQFLSRIGLYGRITGLVVVHVIYGIPITTLIFRNYYAEVPDELLEASFMDGSGFFGTFLKILLPISAPGFVVVVIWQFTNIWNEFLFAVTITQRPSLQPVTVALQNLAGSQIVEWNVQMAGALLAALPTLLIYIILGKFFVRGLLAGSIK